MNLNGAQTSPNGAPTNLNNALISPNKALFSPNNALISPNKVLFSSNRALFNPNNTQTGQVSPITDKLPYMARITKNPATLRDQLTIALAGATAEALNWPASAPTLLLITAARDDIAASITDTDAKKTAWQVAAQVKSFNVGLGYDVMKAVDEATDLLYAPDAAEKANFGLTPKGAAIEALHKLIAIEVEDGPVAGSLTFDWESIDGAAYEVNWSGTSDFAVVVGSATSASASDYIISGLTPGTQYWMRVRPVRGGATDAWSDPATRVAPV